jgi:hypothetical protein
LLYPAAVTPGSARVSSMAGRLLTGDQRVFVGLLGSGLAILAFLLVTVHNRKPWIEPDLLAWTRAEAVITAWIEEGPLKYGDYRRVLPFERGWGDYWGAMDPSREYIYRSLPQGHLRVAYLLEHIHYKARGFFSRTLMVLHNQAVVWLSSAILGYLVYLVAVDLEIEAAAAFLLGLACQVVHQTFPWNLEIYWAISPHAVAAVVLAWILVIVYRVLRAEDDSRKGGLKLAIAVFLMFYVMYRTAFLLAVSLILTTFVLNRPALRRLRPWSCIVLPGTLVLGLLLVQRVAVAAIHPEVEWVGSGFLFRSGLDGSVAYAGDHWSLVASRQGLGRWPWLLAGGAAAVAALVTTSLKRPELRPAVTLLGVALGTYVLAAFTFVQSGVIHPAAYDTYLALPLIAALLGFLPASLERRFARPGLFVLLALFVAYGLSFVQLRQFAIAHPVPPEARWLAIR